MDLIVYKAFGEDHDNLQESIFKLFDSLFRGQLQPDELESLYVSKHVDPNGVELWDRLGSLLGRIQALPIF